MSRYNETAELITYEQTQDEDGNVRKTRTSEEVFCDKYMIGSAAWSAAKASGVNLDAEIKIRSIDYRGQIAVSLSGVEYSVERVLDTGEFTRLSLARKLSNAG